MKPLISFVLLICACLMAAPQTTIKVMLIGTPLYDGASPMTGRPYKSVFGLFAEFERQNPDIKIEILPAQWGSSSQGYISKTRALLLSEGVDVLEMPISDEFARQEVIDDLGPRISNDASFDTSQYLAGIYEGWFTWIPARKQFVPYGIPYISGSRLIGYDKKIFDDWGVEYLSENPTPAEIMEKAGRMTGKNPKTGHMNYGIFFDGKYNVFVTMNAIEGFGGSWGHSGADGEHVYQWNTPENVRAMQWVINISKYAPKSFLTGAEAAMVWETPNNNIAIRLDQGSNVIYDLPYRKGAFFENGRLRFGYSQTFKDMQGKGGLFGGSTLSLARSSKHKAEAWRFMKWLSQDEWAQKWCLQNYNGVPVIRASKNWPENQIGDLSNTIIGQMETSAPRYPWMGAPPRFIIQSEVEKAVSRANACVYDTAQVRVIAAECMQAVQAQTDTWLQGDKKIPLARMRPFAMRRFGFPLFIVMFLFVAAVIIIYRKDIRKYWVWYMFLLPGFTAFALFLAYPLAESFRLSFFKSNGFLEAFAGLDNFKEVMSSPVFGNSLYNTLYIGILNLTLGIPIGFILASLINSQRKATAAFKILYFMPMVTSVIAASIVFKYLFDPNCGPINYYLHVLGVDTSKLLWLNDPATAKFVVVFFALWHGAGYTILICLAGLQTIPDSMYEAAAIDGAGPLQKWWHITLPNMRPTFVFLFMTGCIGALKRFEDVYTLGGAAGSPARSIQTVVAFIFEQAFGTFRFGTASAAAYVLFFIILAITLVNYRFMLHKEQKN